MTSIACLLAFAVSIHPGAYTGRYYVDSTSNIVSGDSTPDLAAGDHFVDDSSSLGGSAFGFHVDDVGTVTTSSPSATASGSSLTFNTADITFDPGDLTGSYIVSSNYPLRSTGVRTFALIRGLIFTVDDGTESAGSSFLFTVNADGTVSASSQAASASGSTLSFITVPFSVDPGQFTGAYTVTATAQTLYFGKNAFSLLAGLEYAFDDGASIAGSAMLFTATSGGTLKVPNVPVVIDPGSYARPYRINQTPYSGLTFAVLIPNLAFVVGIGAEGAIFTPSCAGVTPSSVTVAGVTFNFSSPGSAAPLINGLLTAGQIANEGVAQSLQNAFNHATTPADFQKLQARLDHELALGHITQQAHDALTAQASSSCQP